MKQIPLTQGQVAIVDDSDFEYLNQFKWWVQKRKHGFHAVRAEGGRKNRTYVYMHRQILGLTSPLFEGEHRDGNGLNNQRGNLRVATKQQNARGFQTPRAGKTSKFRGVSRHQGKWIVRLRKTTKHLYLGVFADEEEAARAYDKAALEHFGKFAQPNFP